MINKYLYSHYAGCVVFSLILLLAGYLPAQAQVVKSFTQRTSPYAPQQYKKDQEGKIYNLRGDFVMAGNTNLTFTNYADDASNSSNLTYVDIDLDGTTINSSSSSLNITNDPCTEIVYAGLYWSGRADTGNQTFDVTSTTSSFAANATNETFYHNNPNNGAYSMIISRQTVGSNYYPRYSFNFEGTVVEFNFTNDTGAGRVQYRYGTSGSFTNIAGTYVTGSGAGGTNRGRFTFTTAFEVTVNGRTYKINYLNRDSRDNRSESNYRDTGYGYAEVNLKTLILTPLTKTLDKRKIRFKKEGQSYTTYTANAADINYPNGSYANMYTGYVDVTDYVRQHKGGNYFVADLATTQGSSDNTGYFGGWGLVVIYANPNMKWRDITIFDGYAYVAGNVTTSHELPISGFESAQNGPVNVDIGVMAGEGDRDISGDYFKIRNAANNNWIDLSHSGNSTGNFFNSSINVGTNSKNPDLLNNTGIDIAKFSLSNATKSIIGNSQTSTRFQYGSTQDTYIIYTIVFAVDAYIPEVEGVNQVLTSQTTADINNLQPGDEVTYTLDVYNYGSDFIDNGKIDISIPNAMKVMSYSMQQNTQAASGATAAYSFSSPQWVNPQTNLASTVQPALSEGGIIRWNLGTIPTQTTVANINDRVPMAKLTYTLKVTDDCMILRTSNDECTLQPEINGEITGTGRNSGENFDTEFVTGYNTDCNSTPIYGGISMQINPSQSFLENCSTQLPLDGEVRLFKEFCTVVNNEIPRNNVSSAYMTGTRFYSNLPTSSNPVEVTGNFPVNPDGSRTLFYAVLPGANQACFYQLATQIEVITQQPSIENINVCYTTPYILNPVAPASEPQSVPDYYYFENGSSTPSISFVQPTSPGVYTYQVAFGKEYNGTFCFGPKTTFTITIRNCQTPVNPMIYTPINRQP